MRVYKKSGLVGKVAVWLASNIAFTVSGIFFQVLSLSQSIRILKGLHFMPLIFYGVVYIVFTVGATREGKQKKKSED